MTERENEPDRSPAKAVRPPEVSSEELLQGQKEVRILHGDDIYVLRVTRANKLILQK